MMAVRAERVDLADWSVGIRLTERGGLVIRDVTYRGRRVLQSASVPFIYVRYDDPAIGSFTDHLGTESSTPQIRPTVDGFDIHISYDVAGPDYLYEHIWRFFADGQFGPRMIVHGPGEEHAGGHTYFVPFRIDADSDDSTSNSVETWFGPPRRGLWAPVSTEGEISRVPRSRWDWAVVARDTGRRLLVKSADGPNGRCWAIKYRAAESFGALGVIQPSPPGAPSSVPAVFANGESVQDTDVVLWYVAKVAAKPWAVTCGPWLGLEGY